MATLWLEVSPNVPSAAALVSTFITQIPIVTAHVLHGEPKPVLGADHGPLTCERQLHMCAGLDRAQTNSSSVFRIIKIHDCSSRATGP